MTEQAMQHGETGERSAPRPDPGKAPYPGMLWVPSGSFRMGSDHHYPEERPVHSVTVGGFWMDRSPVTNAQFRRFIEATGHVTFAEQPPDPARYPGALPEMLYVGSLVFVPAPGPVDLRDFGNWWMFMRGADWRHPQGPESSLKRRANHPVVHIAYSDAEAYATWAGKELPTEAEWELAARGGLEGADYAWGDEFTPGGKMMANTWQGEFPWQNLATDGYPGTSPVGTFPANGYGLYDMIGNVWEWTTDWYGPGHPRDEPIACCTPANPRGACEQDSYDPLSARDPHPTQGDQSGITPLCAELLPALPPPSALPGAYRHLDLAPGLSLHRARERGFLRWNTCCRRRLTTWR